MIKLYDTLVLNKNWAPVSIIDYKKCMNLIYQDHAVSLDNDFVVYDFKNWIEFSMTPKTLDDGYYFINTINLKIAVPDIIVLKKYNKLPYRDVRFSRQTVFQRDNFQCQYCGKQFKRSELEIEHVVPKCQGGNSHWSNVVSSCGLCNDKKGGRTPEQAGMKLIKEPSAPSWITPFDMIERRPNIRPMWKKYLGKVDTVN